MLDVKLLPYLCNILHRGRVDVSEDQKKQYKALTGQNAAFNEKITCSILFEGEMAERSKAPD